jgi:hypothetical protein
MSLSDLASLGSFVSGIAVVFSFIFLALQMRQANKNQMALLQQGRSQRATELIVALTEQGLSSAYERSLRADMSMDGPSLVALNSWFIAFFFSIEDSFLQNQEGFLLTKSWETDLATLRGVLSLPAGRVAWAMNQGIMGKDYRHLVDSMLCEIKSGPIPDQLQVWKDLMAKEIAP